MIINNNNNSILFSEGNTFSIKKLIFHEALQFILLINVKMQTIVGILTFISRIN